MNQYHILNPRTGKVYITWDAHFDELHTYNKKELLSADFKDKEWAPSNDMLFVNLTQLKLTDDQLPADDWDISIPRPTDIYVSPSTTSLGRVNDTGDDESDHSSDDTILKELKNTDFARPSEAHCFILN